LPLLVRFLAASLPLPCRFLAASFLLPHYSFPDLADFGTVDSLAHPMLARPGISFSFDDDGVTQQNRDLPYNCNDYHYSVCGF
jgi:hypothetical protein